MASEGDTDEGDTAGGTSQEQQQLVHLHHPSLLIYGDEREKRTGKYEPQRAANA